MKLPADIRSWMSYLAGLAVAGVVGNSIYEVIKPYGYSFLVGILNLTTLGVAGFRDAVYVEVASGYRDRFSSQISLIIITLFVGYLFATILSVRRMTDKLAEIRQNPDKIKALSVRKFPFAIFLVVSVACAVPLILIWAQTFYVNETQGALVQAEEIIAPFISEQERLIFRSRVARIRSRSDFVSIWNEMNSIADQNSAKIPEIIIF